MRILYFDCFSGISGDMTVGALCDLGVKPSTLEWELSKLDLGDFHMHFDRRQRGAIEGIHFSIHEGQTHHEACDHDHGDEAAAHDHGHPAKESCDHDHDHDHGDEVESHGHDHSTHECSEHHGDHSHEHSHGHAPHRRYTDIREMISKSELSPFVKERAISIFHRIAVAEAKIHGTTPEEVHFHEVGALDSIADVVCACVGIEALGVQAVHASELQEGRGWIQCDHGRFPVPAPATLEILAGIPLRQTEESHELITPTGAAILAEFSTSYGLMPPMKTLRIGYGVGTRELASRPNVLRAVLGERLEASS
ncbi:MAG: hypothetical protein RLZZ399_966 [Verrucomicrobiota bacterium]|jgi:uncharacterized protein (DUF111 family)